MGSKVSKVERRTPRKTEAVIVTRIPRDTIHIPPRDTVPVPPQDTVTVPLQDAIPIIPQNLIPRVPHDIINEILDHLAHDSDLRSLRACALVSGSWAQPCQRHLFHTTIITPANAPNWLKTFPAQEDSPAHHVRDLRLEIGQVSRIPEKFFECIPWFANVDRMSFLGYGGVPLGFGRFSPLWEPSRWNLPRSVTSLTIETGAVTLVQVRDIMAQLPNLDDLVLSGFLGEDKRKLPTGGTVLKGRFRGRLMLSDSCVSQDIINMLLEIPSGLRFVELEIDCARNRLLSAVRLAEACDKTLVKLSQTVNTHCKSHSPVKLIHPQNIDADAIPNRPRSPRHFRAVLRLFQVPTRSRSDLWLYCLSEGERYALDPHGSLNPQTRYLSTLIRHQTRLPLICRQTYRNPGRRHGR